MNSTKDEISIYSRRTNPFQAIYQRLYRAFGPQHWWPADTAFEVMIGSILTQNTAWPGAARAVGKIRDAGLLSPRSLRRSWRRLPTLIRASGCYRLKARRLLNFLDYYLGHYQGREQNFRTVPTSRIRRELLEVKGIGPETADSILLYALGRPVFVVDAYTRRVLVRHRIITDDLDYEAVRRLFESNLAKRPRIFNEYHALLVRLGKEYCKKNDPLCAACPLRDL